MAEPLTARLLSLRAILDRVGVEPSAELAFLRSAANLHNEYPDSVGVQDILLRALDVRSNFSLGKPILDGLVRSVGLFPYLTPESLSLRDRLAYELHRAPFPEENVVLHRPQANILGSLVAGENIILSAPTSFGKSLLIDALIAARRPRKAVIIVPTIALIEETRQRLAKRFGKQYKIVAHESQAPSKCTIYVLTQERALDRDDLGDTDFFVIDEFYKLSPIDGDDQRAHLLNYAFLRLLRTGAQFYLLGPNISGISLESSDRVSFQFIKEPYCTVATETHRVKVGGDPLKTLAELCRELKGQTIVYCAHPTSAWKVLRALETLAIPSQQDTTVEWAIDWCEKTYHPQWNFISGLRLGIGIHHGRIPRALAHFVVREFNHSRIRLLVCTSTLIEGVNTSARNIVVFDNKVSMKYLDAFTFNNIKGRSGRMFRHFIGHVYLFAPPPDESLPVVDIPILQQPIDMPDSMLVQLDSHEMRDELRARFEDLIATSILPAEVLRANRGIDPTVQNAIAEEVSSLLRQDAPYLLWNGTTPSTSQLVYVVDIIWRHFNGADLVRRTFSSAEELAGYVAILQRRPAVGNLIKSLIDEGASPDEAVNRTLDRQRQWISFHLPQKLRVISRIVSSIAKQANVGIECDYCEFASSVEAFFYPPHLVALEEYGVPIELLRKLLSHFEGTSTLDDALEVLRRIDPSDLGLHRFEEFMLMDAIDSLG
jgi:hypothetical protein